MTVVLRRDDNDDDDDAVMKGQKKCRGVKDDKGVTVLMKAKDKRSHKCSARRSVVVCVALGEERC